MLILVLRSVFVVHSLIIMYLLKKHLKCNTISYKTFFFLNWVFGGSSLYDLMSTDGLLRNLGFILGMKWDMPSDLKTEPQKGLILSNAFTFD